MDKEPTFDNLHLEFENDRLVKVRGMRPEYISGYQLVELVRSMATVLVKAYHNTAEVAGCLDEYMSTPCKSLERRLADAIDRATGRITPARKLWHDHDTHIKYVPVAYRFRYDHPERGVFEFYDTKPNPPHAYTSSDMLFGTEALEHAEASIAKLTAERDAARKALGDLLVKDGEQADALRTQIVSERDVARQVIDERNTAQQELDVVKREAEDVRVKLTAELDIAREHRDLYRGCSIKNSQRANFLDAQLTAARTQLVDCILATRTAIDRSNEVLTTVSTAAATYPKIYKAAAAAVRLNTAAIEILNEADGKT